MLKYFGALFLLMLPHLVLAMAGPSMQSCHHHAGHSAGGCTDFIHPLQLNSQLDHIHPVRSVHFVDTEVVLAEKRATEEARKKAESDARDAQRIEAERLRLQRLQGIQGEMRAQITAFIGRSDHSEESVATFVRWATEYLIQYPEVLPVLEECFRSESRLIYKLVMGGVIYIINPHHTEVTHWMRGTAGMPEQYFEDLDQFRAYSMVQVTGVLAVSFADAWVMSSSHDSALMNRSLSSFTQYVLGLRE